MKDNIQRVAERGERLDALQDKTGTFHFNLLNKSRVLYVYTIILGHFSLGASAWIDKMLTLRLPLCAPYLDGLAVSAQSFRKGANRVRKRMWWQNMKVSNSSDAGWRRRDF